MQETIAKWVLDIARLDGKSYSQGIVQEIKIWSYIQMVYA